MHQICVCKAYKLAEDGLATLCHKKPYIVTLASLRLLQGCYPAVHIPVSLQIPCISSVCHKNQAGGRTLTPTDRKKKKK